MGRPAIQLRDVTDLAGCRDVVDMQVTVWGQDGEIVPASLLSASVKRGGILIGAYDEDRLVGFVWSMPGSRDGAPCSGRTCWACIPTRVAPRSANG